MYPGPDTFLQYYIGPYLQLRRTSGDTPRCNFCVVLSKTFLLSYLQWWYEELNSVFKELDDDESRKSVFCAVPMIDQ